MMWEIESHVYSCWECKMEQSQWKMGYQLLKIVNIELPFDLAILLLIISLKKLKWGSWTDLYSSMFIEALFMIAKRWKQPKCPSTDEWETKGDRYIQWNIIQLKEGYLNMCYNMDEPCGPVMLSEIVSMLSCFQLCPDSVNNSISP